jgi:hypothetical protein
MRGFTIAQGELGRKIRQLPAACAGLHARPKPRPDGVARSVLTAAGDLVKLDVE